MCVNVTDFHLYMYCLSFNFFPCTLQLGIIIRAAAIGHPPPTNFILVTMGSTAFLLVGWRALLFSIFPTDKGKKNDVYKRGSPFELFEVCVKIYSGKQLSNMENSFVFSCVCVYECSVSFCVSLRFLMRYLNPSRVERISTSYLLGVFSLWFWKTLTGDV